MAERKPPKNISKGNQFYDEIQTGGRPKKVLTDEGIRTIESLARIQCTDEEIAAVLGVSTDMLTNGNNKKAFAEAKKRGIESGKASLRRMQFKAAEAGNATMLIWLGKQFLEQTDKMENSFKDTNVHFDIIPASRYKQEG